MSEPKPFASLSSTLLARKGQAKPAMRPQGFAGFGMATAPTHDDLGWNDMGHDPVGAMIAPQHSAEIVPILPEQAVTAGDGLPVDVKPVAPVVVRQQEALAREMTPEPAVGLTALPAGKAPATKPRAAAGSKGKAAFTLRLDPDRHLRLRLACAVNHSSAQQLVVQALDLFLEGQPDVARLAATAQSKL